MPDSLLHHLLFIPADLRPIGLILLAYLIGSIPFGYIAGKLNGLDLREHGSNNIGATNAIRVLGKAWGIPVFILDFLKGLLPVLAVKLSSTGELSSMPLTDTLLMLGVLLAVVLGHTFTIFLHFKGGKGVATTAGGLFALSLLIGSVTLLAWITCMIITRYVSLSSIVAGLIMLAAALYETVLVDGAASISDWLILTLLGLISVLVIVKHRSNISRILAGTEPKAFSKKK